MDEPFAGIFDASEDVYVLYLDRAAAELRFEVTTTSGSASVGIPQALLATGRWLHVVGLYDGAELRIHLDGEQVGAAVAHGGTLVATGQVPAIGKDGLNDAHFFDGAIDDLAIWRRAPNAAEIALLLDRTIFVDGVESANTAAWHLATP